MKMSTLSSPLNELVCWYALATKPRQEDRAVENLIAWGIPTLAPKLDAQDGQRRKLLFAGYIFARFNIEVMGPKIRFTRGISYIVSFGGRPAVVTDEIISSISNRIDENGVVTLGRRLQTGDPIVITAGPLHDLEGVFDEELSDGERVRILLTTVAYTGRIKISKHNVKRQCGLSVQRANC